MKFDFDEIIDRAGSGSYKYDYRSRVFGRGDVIPLWVADMDFSAPEAVVSAMEKRLSHHVFGYPVRPDTFFDSIIAWMRKRHGWDIARDWIVFSPGVVPALNFCIQALTAPGDGVIVQPPVYHLFFSAVLDHGRTLLHNELVSINGRYSMDFDGLEYLMRRGARMMFLCSPHNPVGRCWTPGELGTVAALCKRYGVILVSDEIHSDLVFPGCRHVPIASFPGEDPSGIITCVSPSKTFNLAGLSTAAVIIPDPGLRKEYRRVINSFHLSGGNIFGDCALEAAYSHGEEWLEALLDYLGANRDFAVRYINENAPGISVTAPEATFLLWLNCGELGLAADQLRKFFVDKAGVGLSDGTIFGPGGNAFQRLNIACPRSVLENALELIAGAAESLRRNKK
jgi:cystathionine beta-lyase